MRMRKKKNGEQRMAACADLLLNEFPVCFGNSDAPLHLEIGCGKGAFILQSALRDPEIRFVGMEKISDVILAAMERLRATPEPPANVRFLNHGAEELDRFFAPHSLDRIYLNFSDPWPKAGHEKRRLTHPDFLNRYRSVLRSDGAIFLKTDNRALFDYSLTKFQDCGFHVKAVTYDLHASPWKEGNIMTEYETAFTAKGFPICRAEAWI